MAWIRLCPSARTDYDIGLHMTACVDDAWPVYLTTDAWYAVPVLTGTGRP